MNKYNVTVSATTAPVSTADLKTHLFLFSDTSYDTELAAIILAAQGYISDILGEYVSATSVKFYIPSNDDVILPHRNITSITSVDYFNSSDADTVLASSEYYLDDTSNDVQVKFTSHPTCSSLYEYPASITYVAGMAVVPEVITQAMLVVSAELFEVRSESTVAKRNKAMDVASKLLQKYRRW